MCVNCRPLVGAIEAYIQKADDDLAAALAEEGFCDVKRTVKFIGQLENEVAEALLAERDYILAEAEKAADLQAFAEDIWPDVQLNDVLLLKLALIFKERFSEFVPDIAAVYLAELDKGLKIKKVSRRTTAWVENWSRELAGIMQLNSHREIERILQQGLQEGIGVNVFARRIIDSGLRNEYYKARRVAVTEVLTAHSAAQQEAFMQSPATEAKRWRHTGIYVVGPRPNHLAMDGQIVPKSQPYELVGADGSLYYPQFPRDTSLPPAERIECHCLSQGIASEAVLGLPLAERQRLQQQAIDKLDAAWAAEYEARNQAMVGYPED